MQTELELADELYERGQAWLMLEPDGAQRVIAALGKAGMQSVRDGPSAMRFGTCKPDARR